MGTFQIPPKKAPEPPDPTPSSLDQRIAQGKPEEIKAFLSEIAEIDSETERSRLINLVVRKFKVDARAAKAEVEDIDRKSVV